MRTTIKSLLVGLIFSCTAALPSHAFELKEGMVIPVGGYCSMKAVDAIIEQAKISVDRGNAMTEFQVNTGGCRRAISRSGFIIEVVKKVKVFTDVDEDFFEVWEATIISDSDRPTGYVMVQVQRKGV